jgi:thiosulfate reductase cytochrome b subunit
MPDEGHRREQDPEPWDSQKTSEPPASGAESEPSASADQQQAMLADDEVTGTALSLAYKHRLAIRWMHWINFPLLALMIYSGILIYWADSHHEGLNAHRYYRIGVGDWTLLQFFPDWFYRKLHLQFQLAKGLGYHFFFMWFFALNGLTYVLYTIFSGEWRYLVPNRGSFQEARQVFLHDVGIGKSHPPRRKFNGAQQIAYTVVMLMAVGSLLTGLAIYKPAQLHVLTTWLGGYEMARWLHFWLTMGFVAFFLIHVAQVIRAGWNNFRAMIIGYELVPGTLAAKELHHGTDTSGQPAA